MPRGQSGVAALGLAAMMVLFVGTLLGSEYLGKTPLSPDDEQASVLRWAEDAVNGFALVQGRLPCPSRTPGGLENCGTASGKGWLPVASIEPLSSATGSRAPAHVVYAVYRGTGGADPDLAAADDAYQPTSASDYPHIVSNGVDLCGKLRDARPTRSDRASVVSSTGSSGFAHVAYGLAVAPRGMVVDSALNAGPSPRLEDPLRRIDATYHDRVRGVDFDALGRTLSCSLTLASLDTLAIAAKWPDESVSSRSDTIDASKQIEKIEAVIISSEGVDLISSAIDTVDSIWTGAQAQQLVAVATPGLPATLPIFTLGTAGIATSLVANKMAIADTVANALGLITESAYAGTYGNLARKAERSRVWASATPLLAAADAIGTAP
jgi:hypothetical protein